MKNNSKLPCKEELNDYFTTLLKVNLEGTTFEKVANSIINKIGKLPLTEYDFKKNNKICRARIIDHLNIFKSECDISYRTDYDFIKEFGRANIPRQSMFYGAIKSSLVDMPELVNLLEISDLVKKNTIELPVFFMTAGTWRTIDSFKIIEMTFNKESILNNPEVKDAYEDHLKRLKDEYPEQEENLRVILEFFSNQFAKRNIKSHFDYIISAAFSFLVFNHCNNIHGITYPSTRTDYKGNNIAILPDAVEKFLELDSVSLYKITKAYNSIWLIHKIGWVVDFGPLNSDFKWRFTNDFLDNKVLFK